MDGTSEGTVAIGLPLYLTDVNADAVSELPPDGPDLAAGSDEPVDHEEHIGPLITGTDPPLIA